MSDSSSNSSYYYNSSRTTEGKTCNTDADGNTVVRPARQDLDHPQAIEQHRYNSTGHEQLETIDQPNHSAGGTRSISESDRDSPYGTLAPASTPTGHGLNSQTFRPHSYDSSTGVSGENIEGVACRRAEYEYA